MTTETRYPQRDTDPDRQQSRLSKFLALVLRHRAPEFGLHMNDEGFVSVDELLDLIHEQSGLDWVERNDLESVGQGHVRKRFEISDDLIRATYGHSFHKQIRYEAIEPPEHLYAGVPQAKTASLRERGLHPEGRQYVHLTDDLDEAMQVGKRQDENAEVIVIRALEASKAGINFHKPTDGLFLCGPIPADFLDISTRFGRRPRRGSRRR